MLKLTDDIAIPEAEIDITAVRSQGPGGQHVNKVASAVPLRFDVRGSPSLPDEFRARVLALRDRRISADGVVVIKAQRSRSQDRNRADALARLEALLRKALETRKPRKRTRPPRAAREKRLDDKARRSRLKQQRGRVTDD